jgi:hypothetical protein
MVVSQAFLWFNRQKLVGKTISSPLPDAENLDKLMIYLLVELIFPSYCPWRREKLIQKPTRKCLLSPFYSLC